MGKSANVIDLSMKNKTSYGAHEETAADSAAEGGGDKSFDDVTDLDNEDFIYVY